MTEVTSRNFDKMVEILRIAGPKILSETWGYYRLDTKEVDGVAKWTGWLLASDEPGGQEAQVGTLANLNNSRVIITGKQSVLTPKTGLTSIEHRNPTAEPKIWGGGILTDIGNKDALTGGTELQDHIVLNYLQEMVGRISQERALAQVSLEHPGIRASIADSAHLGLNPGSYMSMRSFIEQHLRKAAETL
jgi:hypothetical protein